jgi:hypothetical protein
MRVFSVALISLPLMIPAGLLTCSAAQAQYTDGVIKIGVLTDMSSLYSDANGARRGRTRPVQPPKE